MDRSREWLVSPSKALRSGMGRTVCRVPDEEREELVSSAEEASSGMPGIGEHCAASSWKCSFTSCGVPGLICSPVGRIGEESSTSCLENGLRSPEEIPEASGKTGEGLGSRNNSSVAVD